MNENQETTNEPKITRSDQPANLDPQNLAIADGLGVDSTMQAQSSQIQSAEPCPIPSAVGAVFGLNKDGFKPEAALNMSRQRFILLVVLNALFLSLVFVMVWCWGTPINTGGFCWANMSVNMNLFLASILFGFVSFLVVISGKEELIPKFLFCSPLSLGFGFVFIWQCFQILSFICSGSVIHVRTNGDDSVLHEIRYSKPLTVPYGAYYYKTVEFKPVIPHCLYSMKVSEEHETPQLK